MSPWENRTSPERAGQPSGVESGKDGRDDRANTPVRVIDLVPYDGPGPSSPAIRRSFTSWEGMPRRHLKSSLGGELRRDPAPVQFGHEERLAGLPRSLRPSFSLIELRLSGAFGSRRLGFIFPDHRGEQTKKSSRSGTDDADLRNLAGLSSALRREDVVRSGQACKDAVSCDMSRGRQEIRRIILRESFVRIARASRFTGFVILTTADMTPSS